MAEILAKGIVAGDVLTVPDSDSRVVAESDAEESSAMPGLVRIKMAFGTLYMDPDYVIEVNEDD